MVLEVKTGIPSSKDFFDTHMIGYLAYLDKLLTRYDSGEISRDTYLQRHARAFTVKDMRVRYYAQQNLTDQLTHIPNGRAVDILFEYVRSKNEAVDVFMVDVDNAKIGNSELGHRATNGAIVEVVDASEKTLEKFSPTPVEYVILRRGEYLPKDGIMRMHTRGDEFIVFAHGLKTKKHRERFAEYLRTTYFNSSVIQELNQQISNPFSITVVGRRYLPSQDPSEFLNELSAGPLSQAKQEGKNKTLVI